MLTVRSAGRTKLVEAVPDGFRTAPGRLPDGYAVAQVGGGRVGSGKNSLSHMFSTTYLSLSDGSYAEDTTSRASRDDLRVATFKSALPRNVEGRPRLGAVAPVKVPSGTVCGHVSRRRRGDLDPQADHTVGEAVCVHVRRELVNRSQAGEAQEGCQFLLHLILPAHKLGLEDAQSRLAQGDFSLTQAPQAVPGRSLRARLQQWIALWRCGAATAFATARAASPAPHALILQDQRRLPQGSSMGARRLEGARQLEGPQGNSGRGASRPCQKRKLGRRPSTY